MRHCQLLGEAARRANLLEQRLSSSVLRGWDNQLIAEELGCTIGTVKKHLQHIFEKLGVDNRFELLHLATRN